MRENLGAQAESNGDRYADAMKLRPARIKAEERAAKQALATGGSLASPKSIPLDPAEEERPSY